MITCDFCHDGRHVRCGGRNQCGCNLCATAMRRRNATGLDRFRNLNKRDAKARYQSKRSSEKVRKAGVQRRPKLTPVEDARVLAALHASEATAEQLAQRYGVSVSTIYTAARRADDARRAS